ncbi:hypothetical protein [Desulfovibrio sp. UCD-KL4C]|uniref:hypothetical protein n=1 Tax=Desulfovibrio sp. UCD-KL4C TaxID=2578120 RepID=UPI0025C34F86|nr:hypothetical protein [Desulfovibrio sp. UCD-KL4C]
MIAKGYDSFGGVLDVTNKTPGQIDFTTISDPYLVYSNNSNFLAVTDHLLIKSVFFRLLGLFNSDTKYFSSIYFDHQFGGIWLVN